jgi:hypothetical protein
VFFQKNQSESAEATQVFRCMTFLRAVVVFVKADIQVPMQAVLNAPVITQSFAVEAGFGWFTADEKAHFAADFAVDVPFAATHADDTHIGPRLGLAQVVGILNDRVQASFQTTMGEFVG